jgi:hypothetical protein
MSADPGGVQDEQPDAEGQVRPDDPDVPPTRRGRRRLSWALLVLVMVLALAAVAVLGTPGPWPWEARTGTPDAGTSPAPTSSAAPTSGPVDSPPPSPAPVPDAPADRPTAGGGTTRLGTPPLPPPGGGPHVFATFQTNGVTPVAYDPCRQVHYVIRPDEQPDGGEAIVQAAIARLSQATGLQFVYDGPTDEVPSDDRPSFQPDRYGDRWAPVLVAWQTDVENPTLAGDVVGQGGSTAVSLGDGPRVYLTGSVVLDSAQFPGILQRRNGAAIAQGIVLHELGHVVGLDHVDDDGQLMYPQTVPGLVDFHDGDLEGLSRLGRGPCVPEL